MSSLADKVALITGASSGIGAGAARHFASLGCRLALHGRNVDNLNKVAAECKEQGLAEDHVLVVTGDLAKDEELRGVVDNTITYFKQLDVLVNNAGILVRGGIETAGIAEYDEQMNINCRTYYFLSHLAIPHLKKTKGTIVNVSSVCGTRSFPNVITYCMAKAAIDQMTRCAAIELAQYGIRVNAINPGVIVTEVHKRAGVGEEEYQKFLEHSKRTHPLGRTGTVDETAKLIAFLASEDSSFITGDTIPIDGGRHAMCPR